MTSSIHQGEIIHWRTTPKEHTFTYPAYFFCFDLEEVPHLNFGRWLQYNRAAIFSIRDSDYLSTESKSILEKFSAVIESAGGSKKTISKTYLLTVPRYFGYVFNPVSFYVSLNEAGSIHSVVAEVRNTFGERHVYLVRAPDSPSDNHLLDVEFSKEFYVSPFLDVCGTYRFTVTSFGPKIDIQVRLVRDSAEIFRARLRGDGIPMSEASLRTCVFKFPLYAALTMLRIKRQALLLIFLKNAFIYKKPLPRSAQTSVANQSIWYHLRLHLLTLFGKLTGRAKQCSPEECSQ